MSCMNLHKTVALNSYLGLGVLPVEHPKVFKTGRKKGQVKIGSFLLQEKNLDWQWIGLGSGNELFATRSS